MRDGLVEWPDKRGGLVESGLIRGMVLLRVV